MDLPKGLAGVVVDQTEISSTAGGKLVYADYEIEELAQASYEEIVFLLWHTRLPQRANLRLLASN